MRSRQIQAYLSQEELLREKAVWKPGFPGPWQHAGWTYDPATGLWSANPVAGAELLTNGDFSAWTGDNPDNWTLQIAEDAGNYITENPPGQAQLVCDGVAFGIRQENILTLGAWYKVTFDLNDVTLGGMYWKLNDTVGPAYTTVGTKTATDKQSGPLKHFYIFRYGACNVTFDNFSVKPLTLSHLLCIRNYGRQVGLKAPATIAAGFQVGVLVRYSDANNFLLAYHNRTNAYLVKRVAGTYTQLIGAAAAYAAGRVIEVRLSGDTAQLYYNDVQIGTDQDVSTVPAGTWGGMFSTGSAADGCYVGTPTVV